MPESKGRTLPFERLPGIVLIRLRGVVKRCQQAGSLNPGPVNILAVTVWALIHGIVSLVLDAQVSHDILGRYSLRHLLILSLAQLAAPGAAFDRAIEREPAPF